MSQAGMINTSGGPVPPTVATTYVTDVNSPAIPAANILNVPGGFVADDNDNGIQTDGSSGSNTLTVELTNRMTGTVTTNDATLTTIITLPLGAVAASYYVWGCISAFNSSSPGAGDYSFSGGYRTDGASATELGTEFHDTFEEAALSGVDIFLNVSGNDVLVQVQGIALSINWNALLEYRKVT